MEVGLPASVSVSSSQDGKARLGKHHLSREAKGFEDDYVDGAVLVQEDDHVQSVYVDGKVVDGAVLVQEGDYVQNGYVDGKVVDGAVLVQEGDHVQSGGGEMIS